MFIQILHLCLLAECCYCWTLDNKKRKFSSPISTVKYFIPVLFLHLFCKLKLFPNKTFCKSDYVIPLYTTFQGAHLRVPARPSQGAWKACQPCPPSPAPTFRHPVLLLDSLPFPPFLLCWGPCYLLTQPAGHLPLGFVLTVPFAWSPLPSGICRANSFTSLSLGPSLPWPTVYNGNTLSSPWPPARLVFSPYHSFS